MIIQFRTHTSAEDLPAAPDGMLLYGCGTALHVRCERWLGLAPPRHLVWLPGSQRGRAVAGEGVFRSAALHDCWDRELRAEPAVIDARPLLGALLERAEQVLPGMALEQATNFVAVILHEVRHAKALPCAVPWPRDARLAQVCRAIESRLDTPADSAGDGRAWQLSSRSLHRLFVQECGVPTGCWVRRRRLMEALTLMSASVSLPEVARRVGYSSFSAFGAMFRQALGEPPRRFQARFRP